jgi:cytochrome c553
VALTLGAPQLVPTDRFTEDLARVDRALKENPSHALPRVLQTCRYRRDEAVRLYNAGFVGRAERRLKACMQDLKIAQAAPEPVVQEEAEQKEAEQKEAEQKEAPPSMEETQARAAREIERALTLKPDIANGLKIYRTCAECHMPEGWGRQSGRIPQLAGQHRTVVIKQLADIRAGNRGSVVMAPYAAVELIGGAQAIADVAAYIDSLEMGVDNGKGPGKDLQLGAQLYRDNCARCHGETGDGDSDIRTADPGAALRVPGAPVRGDSEGGAQQRESGDGGPDPRLRRSSDPGGAGLRVSARTPRGSPRTVGLAQSGLRASNSAPLASVRRDARSARERGGVRLGRRAAARGDASRTLYWLPLLQPHRFRRCAGAALR